VFSTQQVGVIARRTDGKGSMGDAWMASRDAEINDVQVHTQLENHTNTSGLSTLCI